MLKDCVYIAYTYTIMKKLNIFRMVMAVLILFAGCSEKEQQYTRMVWSDEFNYSGLPDSTKWGYELGYLRNHEMQYYTSKLENARVEDGNLVIEAQRDSTVIGIDTIKVTSASVTTFGKHDWTYGRIEVRAKIPVFLGSWPAIWMLGSNITEVGWPTCGEIDMMENVGFDSGKMYFNIHTEAYNHVKQTNKGSSCPVADAQDDYHIYAINWYEDKLDFYFDSVKVFSFANEGTGNATWPFDKAHYLILNLAVGGAWGGREGVDLTAMPRKFLIDYVRVYQ